MKKFIYVADEAMKEKLEKYSFPLITTCMLDGKLHYVFELLPCEMSMYTKDNGTMKNVLISSTAFFV